MTVSPGISRLLKRKVRKALVAGMSSKIRLAWSRSIVYVLLINCVWSTYLERLQCVRCLQQSLQGVRPIVMEREHE